MRVAIALAWVVIAIGTASATIDAGVANRVKQQLDDHNLTLSFKVCGYYCGPGWCSNQWISETSCVAEGIWGIPADPNESCADGCCRMHDHCCGSGDRNGCNRAIVACLDGDSCDGVCAWAVWAAMKVVSEWCCGSSCPSYFDTHGGTREMSLAGQSFCNAESGSRLTFDDKTVSASYAGNQGCAVNVPYALNQTSNRVVIGESAARAQLPSECVASGPFRDMAIASRTWYFPNTAELYVKLVATNTFVSFSRCI